MHNDGVFTTPISLVCVCVCMVERPHQRYTSLKPTANAIQPTPEHIRSANLTCSRQPRLTLAQDRF